ncbi:replication initiation protein (plasmid) [Veillonella rogosae]|uniref:Replication initiation protein n=1 Tax=Veillonella rogosae TaxID=423477 RepID=A0AA47AFJ9_9FIRM|nr:replication initiation protein [Veillonella rogosae]UZG52020.1 replication initiation protein [Veillonella rogosae]
MNNLAKIEQRYTFMIKYHNDMNLIAFNDFSQRELNIFFSLCLLMKDKGTGEITLSYNDIKKIIPDRFESNKKFEEILESVYDKLLRLRLETRDKNKIEKFILFTSYKIHVNEKIVTINTNSDYSYILNNLSKNFTLFELQEFNELSSTYSKHMFRLLKQYKHTGYYKVSVDEFKRLLNVPESYTMRKITDKILSIVLKELSDNFIDLKVNKIKDGRVIKFLEFSFKPQHYKCNDEIDTIDVEATQSNLIEQRKADVLCPKCGKPLFLLTKKDGSTFWGHPDYNDHEGNCKQSYSTKEAIEIDREKKIKVLENEQNRSSIEIEVKALINQHKDIVKLVEFGKEFLTIDQVNKEDLFQNTPLIKIKINSNTITILKQCIDEWS